MAKRKTDESAVPGGGIAQLLEITLGGVKQWILIRGKSLKKPILLYLHGGPGMSLIGVSSEFFKKLEEHFIVVNWDQRGAGLSAESGMPDETFTVNQYVRDAHELCEHLLKRFKRKKLFVVGHSWGSAIGSLLVSRYPELFYAYVGAGQVAHMNRNEEIEYKKLYELAQAENLPVLKRQLLYIGSPPYTEWDKSIRLRSDYTRRYRYDDKSEAVMRRNFIKAAIKSTEYNIADTFRYLAAHLQSVKILWTKLLDVNLFELVPRLEVPAVYILGRFDNVVLPELSEEYIAVLEAPHKELVWFDTGHSMQYETPELFQDTVIEKLTPFLPVGEEDFAETEQK